MSLAGPPVAPTTKMSKFESTPDGSVSAANAISRPSGETSYERGPGSGRERCWPGARAHRPRRRLAARHRDRVHVRLAVVLPVVPVAEAGLVVDLGRDLRVLAL